MQKLNIVCVGKLKEKFWAEAVAEYCKRLSRFAAVQIRELPERRTLAEEGEQIIRELRGYWRWRGKSSPARRSRKR